MAIARVAERLLLASPAYTHEDALPLSIDRGLAWMEPTFEEPTRLYVSPHDISSSPLISTHLPPSPLLLALSSLR